MPSYLLRFLALSLALLILQGSTGVLVDMHFCKGEFKNFALYKKARSCHSMVKAGNKKCLHHQKAAGELPSSFDVKKHNCCENNSFFKKNTLENMETDATVSTSVTCKGIIQIPLEDRIIESASIVPKSNQRVKPPPLGREIRISIQSFLC